MNHSDGKPLIQPQDFFKRVPVSERKALIQRLAQIKCPLLVKIDLDDFLTLIAFRLDDDSNLYCATELEILNLKEGQAVIVNFSLDEERYFFISIVGFENNIPYLKIDVDLFQLQRRQNIRIDIPEDYNAAVNIIEINGRTVFIESKILDVSAGGCRIVVEKIDPTFNMEDKLLIVMHLGHRRPFTFQVNVRFATAHEGKQTLGLQYFERDNILENKMLAMMTDFQRELFIKCSDKSDS